MTVRTTVAGLALLAVLAGAAGFAAGYFAGHRAGARISVRPYGFVAAAER